MSSNLILLQNDYEQSRDIFEKEKARILQVIQGFDGRVEHIGSTSIPSTIGKGIIDILVICGNEKQQQDVKNKLVNLGYKQGELNKVPDGRLFFYKSDGQTQAGDVHLHLVLNSDSANLVSLSFRDYMLKHPEEVEKYNQEKRRLAEVSNNDRHYYVLHKEDYIKKVMDKISKTI